MEKSKLATGKTSVASRIICHTGSSARANSCMPAGTYLTVSGQGGLTDTEPLYRKLLAFIRNSNLSVSGDAYEERLIDGIGSLEGENQIIRISVPVSHENKEHPPCIPQNQTVQ